MAKAIRESHAVKVTEADGAKSGRLKIGLITPGWGSSGYYSAKVLENAAAAQVFPAGTQMFIDHPGEAESYDRPERSLRDLAAVLLEDATWDGEQLSAETQVFGPFVDMLTDEEFAKAIGVSIRAYADGTIGEAEGRKGRIITQLVEAVSVDFVTKAGRGGSILQVLESARPAAVVERAVAHGVAEATANDVRDALSTALREEYGGEKSWVWLRDFDDTTAWFTVETPDESATWQDTYELDANGAAILAGTPVEVRPRTEYVPVKAAESASHPSVPAPAGQSTATESEETNMATTQIEESRLAQLEKDAERVQSLESDLATAQRERDEAREANASRDRRDAAATIIEAQAAEAQVTLTVLERRGLLADLPVAEGKLDEAAFTQTVKTAVAEKAQSAGAGTVVGFGGSSHFNGNGAVTEADVDKAVAGAFGRQIQEA